MARRRTFTMTELDNIARDSIAAVRGGSKMARRGRRSAAKTCSTRVVAFHTRRGGVVTFYGRTGGQKRNGGICPDKGSVGAERTVNRRFATVARRCRGRSRAKRNACVRAGMRGR
jgi:hypothetical protein